MFDVVGVGVPCVDLLVNIDYIPSSNESLLMKKISWQGGGKVPTAIVAMSRLGYKVGIVAKVSDDALGQFIVDDFKRHKVDTRNIVVEKDCSSNFSLVLSDRETEGRNIIYKPGNISDIVPEELDLEYILNSKIVHLSGSTALDLEIAKAACKKGVKVAFDADSYKDIIIEMIPYIDYFIASENFINDYSDRSTDLTVKDIAQLGPEIVIVTLGGEGCLSYHKNEIRYHEAFSVEVVDTTGAGDVFHGAFLSALLEGMSVKDSCKFANAVSSMKCTKIGGRAGLPNRQEVELFMKTGEIVLNDAEKLLQIYSDLPTTGKNIYEPENT